MKIIYRLNKVNKIIQVMKMMPNLNPKLTRPTIKLYLIFNFYLS